MKRRDAAQTAAIEAMQEASAAESLLRCLRYCTPHCWTCSLKDLGRNFGLAWLPFLPFDTTFA